MNADRTTSPALERRPTRADHFLRAIGIDRAFVDAILGDLAEERAMRAACHGAVSARAWYAREALRSMPHVIGDALRRGTPRQRARLAATFVVALSLLSAPAIAAMLLRDGPPSRLELNGLADDGYVVNTTRPVQIEMRVLDRKGHRLDPKTVRFERVGGAPIAVSPGGTLTCERREDATIRASAGTLAAMQFELQCRPVREVRATSWVDFLEGDAPRDLPFVALGENDKPESQLRGSASVIDSSIATMEGTRVRPRAVGQTAVEVTIGERTARMQVVVHELVRSFDGLRADQRFVARSVRLAQGDTVRWSIPTGAFWLKYMPGRAGAAPPSISLEGDVYCSPGEGLHAYRLPEDEYGNYCYVKQPGAKVVLAHGRIGESVVQGWIGLDRMSVR